MVPSSSFILIEQIASNIRIDTLGLISMMNRDFMFGNSYNAPNHPTNQPPASREDFRLYSPQNKRQGESDLFIFNGETPVQDMYGQQRGVKPNLAFVPQRINKSPSQKAFPIIYNTYNDGRSTELQIKVQNLHLNPTKPPRNLSQHPFDTFNQNSNSDISDKQTNHHQYRYQQAVQGGQFHTFQHIPSQSQPQTAKFLQIPDRMPSQNHFSSSQIESYRPSPQIHFEHRHAPPQSPPFNLRPLPRFIPPNNQGFISKAPIIPMSPQNRVVVQQPPKRYQPFAQEVPKLISIPQEEYDKYKQHLIACKKTQEQNLKCNAKIEELGQKEHFYWQQNMTLREENQRLRDLVTHFQKRQKQLLQQRSQQKQVFEEQIIKYRDSSLQEFRLLVERYKLELQKNK